MKTYIAPIGYDSTRVTRPVLNYGIEEGNKIELLRPKKETSGNRGDQAIDDVQRMLEQIEPSVEVDTTEIPHDDFEKAVSLCSHLIRKSDGETVVVFGGGARDIFLPLTVASIANLNSIETSLQFSDIDGEVRERRLPDLTANVPDNVRPTLEAICMNKEGIGLPELGEKLEVSKSTITRHVQLLEEKDLLASETHGKTKVVIPTPTARFLLER